MDKSTLINIIKDCVTQLPLVNYILTNTYSTIYGGLLRWITMFALENNRSPSLDEMLVYLVQGDIDMQVNLVYTKECDEFFGALFKAGALIEFAGANNYIGVCTVRDYPVGPLKKKSYPYGSYHVFIPRPEAPAAAGAPSHFIKYDIHLSKRRVEACLDYTVNGLVFSMVKKSVPALDLAIRSTWAPTGEYELYFGNDEFDLSDLMVKNMRAMNTFVSADSMKRLYRSRKLWRSGFRPADTELMRKWINEVIANDQIRGSIPDETLNTPTADHSKGQYIYRSNARLLRMTKKLCLSDESVQELIAYCAEASVPMPMDEDSKEPKASERKRALSGDIEMPDPKR
jgi:hypothetical protein